MLDFVRSIRMLLDDIGKERGKKIKLGILGHANPTSAYKMGFDFVAMAQEGLLDYYVACPRWETTNTDIPIELWKRLLHKNVELGCSLGLLLNGYRQAVKIGDVATDFGQAIANAHRGADFINLYNHFDIKEPSFEMISHENDFREPQNIRYIYENIGKVDEYEKFERRIPITFDDFIATNESIAHRLPITTKLAQFRIPSGKTDNVREIVVHLVFRDDVDVDKIAVYVNQEKAVLQKDRNDEIIWAKGNVCTYSVFLKADKILGVEVQSLNDEKFTLYYVDALISPVKDE
jgi:hypothetical protein